MPATATLEAKQERMQESTGTARWQVLHAAAQCFAERGFAATSIDDVARRTGATKGRVYHHFASKADLFLAVYRAGMEINFGALEGTQSLGEMARAHALTMMHHQPFQRVLTEGVFMHRHGSMSPRQSAVLRELIDLRSEYEHRFRDALPAIDGDRSIAAKTFLAVLNSTVLWYQPRDENTRDEQNRIANQLVAIAIAGLGPAATEGTS